MSNVILPHWSFIRNTRITAPLKKMWKLLLFFFPCAANRFGTRVMDWGGWKGITAGLCLNQVQREQVAQGLIQLSFECPQGWRSRSLPGHLFQCSTTLTIVIFSCYQSHNLLCSKLSLLPSILLVYVCLKGLALSSLNAPNKQNLGHIRKKKRDGQSCRMHIKTETSDITTPGELV